MKRVIFSLLFCVVAVYLYGQDLYMYVGGQKYSYQLSTSKMLVKSRTIDSTGIKNEIQRTFSGKVRGVYDLKNRLFMADIENMSKENLIKMEKQWNAQDDVAYVSPVLLNEEGREIGGFTNQVLVRLLSLADSTLLKKVVEDYQIKNIQSSGFDERTYLLTLDKGEEKNTMQIACELHDTGLFEYAEPNFINFIELATADTYYSQQWGLKNTGQSGGTSGIDIKAEQAWQLTTGSPNIRIAILDVGVDLNHPDLVNNLLTGFDATGNNSAGAPTGNTGDFAHGTACAGIAAAQANNNRGIAGVAYGCRILPVRIATRSENWTTTETTYIAAGIDWARQNNADVISMSFGITPDNTVTTAINTAVTTGRNNNLGCVVVAAAGNDNSSTVAYPARLPNVIAVGAISQCGTRKRSSSNLNDLNPFVLPDPLGVSCDGEKWWGSNYGTDLNVVAPGVKIYTTCMLNAPKDYTIINNGTDGVYTSNFRGTSAACPHVAGVAALILSVRPDLTQDQVRQAIESNCTKLPGYSSSTDSSHPNGTWNNDVGYGLLNAYAAVNSVIPAITGSGFVCYGSNATFIFNNFPADATTTSWSVSGPVTIVSQSNNSVTVSPTSPEPFTADLTAKLYQNGNLVYTTVKTLSANMANFSINGPSVILALQSGSYTANASSISCTLPSTGVNYEWTINGVLVETSPRITIQSVQGSTSSTMSTNMDSKNKVVLSGDSMIINQPITTPKNIIDLSVTVKNSSGKLFGSASTQVTIYGDYKVISPALSPPAPISITVYPNPVSGILNIETGEDANTQSAAKQQTATGAKPLKTDITREVRLYDGHGKLLHHTKTKDSHVHLNVSHLHNGIYYLHIYNGVSDKPEIRQIMVKH